MEFLYFLEGLRNGFLDALFSFITLLGEETIFMAVGMIFFWCVNKFQGYFLLITGFLGTVINQFLKMLFRVPRPWVKDPTFTIVESAREGASGYSFPSGHTQTSVGLYGGIARSNSNKIIKILCIVACVLVPLSRMYLGVHTPLDVGVSIIIALLLVFGLYPIFKKAENSPKTMYIVLSVLTAFTFVFLLFAEFFPFPNDTNAHNLLSAKKNAYTLIGCMLGLIVTYIVDLKHTNFPVKAVWWAQIIKVIGGLLLVLLVKEVLRFPIDFICGGHLIGRTVRYFLMVIVGGVLWPMTFKWFSNLKNNKKTQKENNQ